MKGRHALLAMPAMPSSCFLHDAHKLYRANVRPPKRPQDETDAIRPIPLFRISITFLVDVVCGCYCARDASEPELSHCRREGGCLTDATLTLLFLALRRA